SFWNRANNRDFVGVRLRGFGYAAGANARLPSTNPTAGADNATGTHRPGHYIRGFCAARDRLRVASDLAMAGWAAPAGEPGGGRSAPPGGARDRTAGGARGGGSAECASPSK